MVVEAHQEVICSLNRTVYNLENRIKELEQKLNKI